MPTAERTHETAHVLPEAAELAVASISGRSSCPASPRSSRGTTCNTRLASRYTTFVTRTTSGGTAARTSVGKVSDEMITDWTSLRYAVVDVEGNGQQPPDLVELGMVAIVGGVIGAPMSWLVRPARPITPMARNIHGIRNEDVAQAPAVEDIKEEVVEALDGAVVVAHNARVDIDVLQRALGDWPYPEVFDTLKLARRLLPGHASYRLGALVTAFNLAADLPEGLTPHRTAYDVLVTARLFVQLACSVSLGELRGQSQEGGSDEAAVLF